MFLSFRTVSGMTIYLSQNVISQINRYTKEKIKYSKIPDLQFNIRACSFLP